MLNDSFITPAINNTTNGEYFGLILRKQNSDTIKGTTIDIAEIKVTE